MLQTQHQRRCDGAYCAAFWAVILDHQPVGALLGLAALALNGLLMLAYIDYYKGVLQRRALAVGEA